MSEPLVSCTCLPSSYQLAKSRSIEERVHVPSTSFKAVLTESDPKGHRIFFNANNRLDS